MDASTAKISGSLASDDQTEVYLNGSKVVLLQDAKTPFGALASFSIISNFSKGTNVLEFRVVNCGDPKVCPSNPTGLLIARLEGSADLLEHSSTLTPMDAGNTPFAAVSGDPVNMSNRELAFEEPPDLVLGGPFPLLFVRSYASARSVSAVEEGSLGENWAHNFEWRLVTNAAGALVTSAQGEWFQFARTNDLWALVSPTRGNFQLVDGAPNRVFGDPRSQRLYTFNPAGQLIIIADGRGNSHSLAYSGRFLTRVSDGLGRALDFVYDPSGHLVQVASDSGRGIGFGYAVPANASSSYTNTFTNTLGNVIRYAYLPPFQDGEGKGRLAGKIHPLGNQPVLNTYTNAAVSAQTIHGTNVTWFAGGDVNTEQDPYGQITRYSHASNGSLTLLEDQAGGFLGVTNDAAGRPIAVLDRNGSIHRLNHDAVSGRPASFTSATGDTTTFTYTPRIVEGIVFHDLDQVTYPDTVTLQSVGGPVVGPARQSYVRDASGNVVRMTNRSGQTASFTYNGRGQVLTATGFTGGTISFAYNADGTLGSRNDAETGSTRYSYDASRRLVETASSDGATRGWVYDEQDRLISATDPRGKVTTFSYDANDRLTGVENALGQVMTVDYDTANRPIIVRDFDGKTIRYAYDKLSRTSATEDRLGSTRRFGFDARGRLDAYTDQEGKVWRLGYDSEAQLVSTTNPLNQTTSLARNRSGSVTAITNALGEVSSLARDSLQRLSAVSDAARRVFSYGYDAHGELSHVANSAIGAVRYARDASGHLTNLVDQTGGRWGFSWSPHGRLESSRDPLDRVTAFTRDGRGRTRRVSYPDGTSRTNSHDSAGNLTRAAYSDGTDLQFDYDALHRLTNASNLSLFYDAQGRVTNTVSSGVDFAAVYDAEGRLIRATYNQGAFAVDYQYDRRGLLTSVKDPLFSTRIDFTHDDAGRLTAATRRNKVNAAWTYDAAGRLTRVRDGDFLDEQLTRSPAGEPDRIKLTAPVANAHPPNRNRVLAFDAAQQISTAGYAFDARGRQTTAPDRGYAWDAANRLKGAGAATFTYNGLGQILTRTEGGTTVRYHYNQALGLAPIVAEQNVASGRMLRYYVWSPGGALLYLVDLTDVVAVRYYHFDHVGSTLALTDADGAVTDAYAYTPYGELTARTGTNPQPFTYVGRWGVRHEPAANVYDMRARYYDPITARFLSRDPRWPRLGQPLAANPYEYAAGSPVAFVDPDGREEIDLLRAIISEGVHGLPRSTLDDGGMDTVMDDGPPPGTVESVMGDIGKVFCIAGHGNEGAAWTKLPPETPGMTAPNEARGKYKFDGFFGSSVSGVDERNPNRNIAGPAKPMIIITKAATGSPSSLPESWNSFRLQFPEIFDPFDWSRYCVDAPDPWLRFVRF